MLSDNQLLEKSTEKNYVRNLPPPASLKGANSLTLRQFDHVRISPPLGGSPA